MKHITDVLVSGAEFAQLLDDDRFVPSLDKALGLYVSWVCQSRKKIYAEKPLAEAVAPLVGTDSSSRTLDIAFDAFARPRFVYLADREGVDGRFRVARFAGANGIAHKARGFFNTMGRERRLTPDALAFLSGASSSGLRHAGAHAMTSAAKVGAALRLLAGDEAWASLPLGLVFRRVAPPIELGQAALLFDDRGRAIAFATWAWIQPGYHAPGNIYPEAWRHEWFEGPRGIAVDLCVSGLCDEQLENLMRSVPEPLAAEFRDLARPSQVAA